MLTAFASAGLRVAAEFDDTTIFGVPAERRPAPRRGAG
jgi:hypothetical protein